VYLQRKHGNPKQVTESAYNLLYTLNQHSYDPDCNLFLKVGRLLFQDVPSKGVAKELSLFHFTMQQNVSAALPF
jgi:hypothetical protein